MSSSTSLPHLTCLEIAKKYKDENLTVTELVETLLQRISERDPIIKAWAYINEELIFKEAKRLDSVPAAERGPLHGIPFGIKGKFTFLSTSAL